MKVRTRRRAAAPFTGSKRLRWAGGACAVGFGSCVAGVPLAMLLGVGRLGLLSLLGGLVLFATLPYVVMHVHLSRASALSRAQKDEWRGAGWGAQPLVVAFYYLLQGGAPLPPDTAKAWSLARR